MQLTKQMERTEPAVIAGLRFLRFLLFHEPPVRVSIRRPRLAKLTLSQTPFRSHALQGQLRD